MVSWSQPPSLASLHSQTVKTLHQSIPEELWPSSSRQRLISACVLSARNSFPCCAAAEAAYAPLEWRQSCWKARGGLVEERRQRHEYAEKLCLFIIWQTMLREQGGNMQWSGLCKNTLMQGQTHTHTLLLSVTMLQCSWLEQSSWLKKQRRPSTSSQTGFISGTLWVWLCGARHFVGLLREELKEMGGAEGFSFLCRWDGLGLGSPSVVLTFLILCFSKLASAPVQRGPSLFLNASLRACIIPHYVLTSPSVFRGWKYIYIYIYTVYTTSHFKIFLTWFFLWKT